ncbi:hypothetical protein WN66_03383 [Saccharomyces cerevisiae]|uniref:Uncharacterized protein n=1 Tax=Saccharomyces cerevisiae (strain AWRI1631) TaxID=545124 RepID=B5VL13_YEAS6|nr:hypothetical protein AWRI1631_100360 [Saccharomyces cerevisiae AWRI1631]KZV10099.1 hypothetical protein WN66_03383 [Saccharomyces cerevisiae]
MFLTSPFESCIVLSSLIAGLLFSLSTGFVGILGVFASLFETELSVSPKRLSLSSLSWPKTFWALLSSVEGVSWESSLFACIVGCCFAVTVIASLSASRVFGIVASSFRDSSCCCDSSPAVSVLATPATAALALLSLLLSLPCWSTSTEAFTVDPSPSVFSMLANRITIGL